MTGPPPIHRVLLVGFMGSGKTLVGQALARRLGWVFRDFDQEVRFRVGLPIPEIFRQHGEGHFRLMEEEVGGGLLHEDEVVLASGGGWPAGEGRMETLPPGTLSIWLQVTPEEAVRRAMEEGPTRPLLAVPDPVARARELLEERKKWYAKADESLDTLGREPEDLARQIEDLMNKTGRERAPSTSV